MTQPRRVPANRLLGFTLAASLLVLPAWARAADAAPQPEGDEPNPVRYETHVAPLLKDHCIRCHNARAMKAELDLSSPQGLFEGGESGLAVVPGKLDESLLFDMVSGELMPPEGEGKPLTAAEVENIRRWIEAGTPFEGDIDPAELVAASEVNNHQIEPLLLLRCAACHGLRSQEAGLDVRTKASLLKGGKSGPAIVPGKPEESLLIKKMRSGAMPPNDRLIIAGVRPPGAAEIDKIARWIELGAPEVDIEPDVATTEPDPLVTNKDRQFWSFQPPRQVPPPQAKEAGKVRNPIDAFALRKLEEKGLTFAPQADKLALMRRAYYDLTGLPPEPEEVLAYLADDDPRAYEKLIERLLASPRYGERWGRMWLDLAGYADSEGKRSADPIRPNAYKYRDYVIRSFNADKPYDRFLLEQIAGDELADYQNAGELTPELIDNLVATGFLRMAPDGTGSDVVNRVPERLEVISDELHIFGSTVLGLTIKCARCHSHKYDPIPQRDYYRLAAVFKGAYDEHDWLKPAFVPGQTKAKKPGRVLPLASEAEMRELEAHNRELDRKIEAEEKQLKEFARQLREKYTDEQLAKQPQELREALRAMLETAVADRDDAQRELAAKYEDALRLSDERLKATAEYKAAQRESSLRVKSLAGQKMSQPQIRALWDRGEPSPTYVYRRGDHLQPARLVGPGVPSVLTDGKTPFDATPPWPGAKKTGRRLALARWLVEPDHPLTARVMVNRIWKGHFGAGLVKTLGNFGHLGARPTHPELLDWLAVEFIRGGWSIKAMHRLMMTSATYRQASTVGDDVLAADPENALLSRMPLRRLDAEEVRDALLLVAGRLSERRFGRPDAVQVRKDGLVTSVESPGGWRRSVYVQHRRKELPTMLETFDQPQMNPNCQQRPTSNVAQQALHLLNDGMVRKLSGYFAERVKQETDSPAELVNRIYLTALSRPATLEEKEIGREALEQLAAKWAELLAQDKPGDDEAARRALQTYCHTIMNSAEFLYVD